MADGALSSAQTMGQNVLNTIGGENAMTNLKVALCATILIVLCAMFLPNVLPKSDDPDNFMNSLNNVLNAHKENLLASVVVVVLAVLVGGLIAVNF